MGEYGIEPQGIVCDTVCVAGCLGLCFVDFTGPFMDVVGIAGSTNIAINA